MPSFFWQRQEYTLKFVLYVSPSSYNVNAAKNVVFLVYGIEENGNKDIGNDRQGLFVKRDIASNQLRISSLSVYNICDSQTTLIKPKRFLMMLVYNWTTIFPSVKIVAALIHSTH